MNNVINITKKKDAKKIKTVLNNMKTMDWLDLYEKEGKTTIIKVLEYIINLINKG